MEIIVAGLITLVIALLTITLIILNESKEELWNEIYKKMRWKDE